jgi:hypothetical protein
MKALSVVLVAAVVLGAGCGAGESGGRDRAENAATQEAPTIVTVEMREWTLKPDPAQAPAGKVTFIIKNLGKYGHSLTVLRTDLPPGELPLGPSQEVDVTAPGIEVIGFVPVDRPGQNEPLTVDLEPGKYVLLSGRTDYASGMYSPFTVT